MATLQVSSFKMFYKKGRHLFVHILTVVKFKTKERFYLFRQQKFLFLAHYVLPSGETGYSGFFKSDSVDQRIFWGLKFLIWGFF